MRYHGVDLHKKYVTVSVRDEAGTQVAFMGRETDIAGYVGRLASEDVVALEASAGALHWAERIGEQGARCVVLDAYRFRIIRDSWQKTDRHDATNLSLALWLAQTTGQVKLPVVWQPSPTACCWTTGCATTRWGSGWWKHLVAALSCWGASL